MAELSSGHSSLARRITYDTDTRPIVGAYLVSQGKRGPGSAYLIVAVRLVKRRNPESRTRYMLTCHRADLAEALASRPVYWIYWYPRTRKN